MRVTMVAAAALMALTLEASPALAADPAPSTTTPAASASPTPSTSTSPTATPPTTPPPARFVVTTGPKVSGTRRYGQRLVAVKQAFSGARPTVWRYQWHRDGRPIAGATQRIRSIQPEDVGHKLSVRVEGRRSGYVTVAHLSRRTAPIRHRVDWKRTLTYSIRTDGRVRSSSATFARQAAETFADARGWRGAGVAFKRVSSGGDFTLVLAQPARVVSYSSQCSVLWSCRVGRYVIINDDRWRLATRTWRASGRSLREYRHMVVNHEVGHRLGKGHRGCPGRGQAAPIMQQQSKGLYGCKANPWPRLDELR